MLFCDYSRRIAVSIYMIIFLLPPRQYYYRGKKTPHYTFLSFQRISNWFSETQSSSSSLYVFDLSQHIYWAPTTWLVTRPLALRSTCLEKESRDNGRHFVRGKLCSVGQSVVGTKRRQDGPREGERELVRPGKTGYQPELWLALERKPPQINWTNRVT